MSQRPRMILDCDPGHDDAFALIVAAKFADLLGVTTVAGNAPLELTTRNARIILDLCGSRAALHSGANKPLVQPPVFADYVHGKSGMDGAVLPEPSRPADSTRAIDFIIDTVRANSDVWLVPTGPLTNIALALTRAPDLAKRIAVARPRGSRHRLLVRCTDHDGGAASDARVSGIANANRGG
ncbi:MAG: hypothetical protein EBT73_01515 [Actinobacteria bacterium]|nr:hypothetical protein [Actinomycetota bacterium]